MWAPPSCQDCDDPARPRARSSALSRISVTVSPGAARSELVGRHGDGWRVRLAAPPERGRANDALIALLAEALGVPKAEVRIVGGRASRHKVVEIDLELAEIERRLG